MANSAERREGYGLVTRVLHWTLVVALAGQFALGWALTRQDDLLRPLADHWFGGEEDAVVVAHAALGVVLLILAAPPPAHPHPPATPTACPPPPTGRVSDHIRTDLRPLGRG